MKELSKRQQDLIKIIVENYIKTCVPVGSKQITDSIDVSSATIRNEMSELESLGYLIQPHISAGRIPTDEAYIYYVNNFLLKSVISSSDKDLLDGISDDDSREYYKKIAKTLADMFGLAIVVSFAKNDIYFTGANYKVFEIIGDKKVLIPYHKDFINKIEIDNNKVIFNNGGINL